MNKTKIILLLSQFSSLAIIVSIAIVSFTHFPDNHISFDPTQLVWLPVLSLVFCGFLFRSKLNPGIKKVHRLALLLALISIATIVIVDRCNILVEYNSWARRGMPGFGQCKGY